MIEKLAGLYAIIPTPAKPDAGSLLATDTVDLTETARVVNHLIDDGVSGLIALGTTGECATLNEADYDAFVSCVLETVERRIPTFIGTTALSGHQTAARLRRVQDLGADGTLLGLPMWQPMTTAGAVDFYASVSDAFPQLAVMVYANARAFRFDFSQPEFWGEISQRARTVVAAKMSRPKDLPELIRKTGGRVQFVPNESTVHLSYRTAPEATTACWATAAAMGPEPALAIMSAVQRHDEAAIDSLSRSIRWTNEVLDVCFKDPEIFARFNIQVEKTRITAAGYCNAGPIRPPYGDLPAVFHDAATECARRWSKLRSDTVAERVAAAAERAAAAD